MITENYIKMCEKAGEIQCDRILGRYDFGDLYYLKSGHKHGGKFRFVGSYDGYDNDKELIEKSIWLPTQEQLQEMMLKDFTVRAIIGGVFYFAVKQYKDLEKVSINELWLAFVMHEKYNKIWNGKKWVFEDETDE